MVVNEAGGPFELVQREIPEPGRGQVVVRVHACGVCHSDLFSKEGGFPGTTYPLVPGHEIAGVVQAVGDGVEAWEVGQRVGIGGSAVAAATATRAGAVTSSTAPPCR